MKVTNIFTLIFETLTNTIERRDKRIAELEAEQRWIPVSTPPEETGYYIVVWQTTCGNGELYSDYGYFKKEEGWGKVNIKFWRHLPHPPKDGDDE